MVGPRRSRSQQKHRRSEDAAVSFQTLHRGTRIYPYEGRRLPKIEVKRDTVRVRIRDPKRYSEFRTQDVGREGFTKRVAGLNPKTGKYETQAYIFDKEDLKNNKLTQDMFNKVIAVSLNFRGAK